jgi:hypothetical protein
MDTKYDTKSNLTEADAKRVKPTLFIGLGGTGAEIIMRLRRRIVSELWGRDRVRLNNVAEFPAARFLHIDLDQHEIYGSEEAGDADPLKNAVKLLPHEKVVEALDFDAYQKGGRLENFPHIREWYPADRLRDEKIDPTTGAGQIRAISRLYFYDRFSQIRAKVDDHLRDLQAGVSHQDALTRLGLETGADRRVVVIASVAGGTGSGSFLDMGYLAKALNVSPKGPVELILLLPSGYSGANQQATEANSYAALMELDACMSGAVRYVHPQYGWGPDWEDIIPGPEVKPYDAIFLADTKNMADVVTNNVRDVYHMMADILFEDFMPGDFADQKRSINSNKNRNRMNPYRHPLGDDANGAVELFPLIYSSIGQCTMESPQNAERSARHLRESRDRVSALFQIVEDSRDIKPSVKEVNEYLKSGALQVEGYADTDFEDALREKKIPEGAKEVVVSTPCGGNLLIYKLIKEILGENNALDHNLLDHVREKFGDLLANEDPETKKENIQAARKEIMYEIENVAGSKDSGKRLQEIEENARKVTEGVWERLLKELYARLDDRKRGGLDYVVALIKSIQGELKNPETGTIGKLGKLIEQYKGVLDILLGENGFNGAAERLSETRRGFLGGGVKKAGIIADEMQEYLYWALRIRLLIKATEELAELYREIVVRLGKATGTDNQGKETFDGLLGELMENRANVRATIDVLERMVDRVEQQQKESYVMRILLPVTEEVQKVDVTDPQAIKDWAESVFGVTGSEEIFGKLKTEADRMAFINKMLDYADQKDRDIPGTRISKLLNEMGSAQRMEQFRQLMRRAAPWCGVKNGPNFNGLDGDKYVILMASGDSDFSKYFADEVKQSLPGVMALKQARVQFSSLSARSEQGKIICYFRVDGFTMDNIQDLRRWRNAYRQVIQSRPVHTSKLARYRHPVIPTPDERRALKESLKTFYAAVLLGVLQRGDDGIFRGIFEGSRLGCGTEVLRRNDPLRPERLVEISTQVRNQLRNLVSNAQRRAVLIALEYYLRAVYPKKPKKEDGGDEQEVKGVAHHYCEQLQREWAKEWGEEDFLNNEVRSEKMLREGDQVQPLLQHFEIDSWVTYCEGSVSDADPAEVNTHVMRNKCVLKKEVFQKGWLEQNVAYFRSPYGEGTTTGGSVQSEIVLPPPPPPLGDGIIFQDAGQGWLTPLIGGHLVRVMWYSGQPYWISEVGGAPQPVRLLQNALQTPPPPGSGLVWIGGATGWQEPFWQMGAGTPPMPARIGWYGNPASPTPCWLVGSQVIPFTLSLAPVTNVPSPIPSAPPAPPVG